MGNVRRRFWLEAVLSGLSMLFLVLTLAWHDWIEIVFGVDPDHHSGSLEWLIVAVAALVAAAFGGVATREFRRRQPAQA